MMRKEYDLKKLNLKPNPYINKLKKSITMRLDLDVLEYFKNLSKQVNVPYQTLRRFKGRKFYEKFPHQEIEMPAGLYSELTLRSYSSEKGQE